MSKHLATQFQEAARHIEAALPDAACEVSTFDSGAVWLDVRLNERLFILRYLPSIDRFGVDEVRDDEGMEMADRFAFDDLDAAVGKLMELLESAQPRTKSKSA